MRRTRSLAEARRDNASAQVQRARDQQDIPRRENFAAMRALHEKTVSTQELEAVHVARVRRPLVNWRRPKRACARLSAELLEFTSGSTSNRPPVVLRAPVPWTRSQGVVREHTATVLSGTPLLEVGDTTDLEVIVEVLSRDERMPFNRARRWNWNSGGGSEPLQAKVRFV
jgi:HlyD family secretion protein